MHQPTYPELVIIGYTNIDINITPSKTNTLPGGAGYFCALAASLFIKNVGLVTRIGYDFEEKFANFLREKVSKDGIKMIPDKNTATSIQKYYTDTDYSQRDVTLNKGVSEDLCPGDVPHEWLQHAKIIHVATMPPRQQQIFINYIKSLNLKAILSCDTDYSFLKDVNNKEIILSNFCNCDLVFMNRDEYELLKSDTMMFKESIVKLDKTGAMHLLKGNVEAECRTTTVVAEDATGAGDVFAGVYLAQRILGNSNQESLEQATKTATLSVTKEGIEHLFE